jgi:phosphatidylserine decarboxylase
MTLLADPRVSQAMGKLVQLRAPRPVLSTAIRAFSKAYGVALDEASEDVGDFETFQAFFTRRLKPGLRPIEQAADIIPSPVDGVLSAFGPLGQGVLIQAKGVEYSLDALLGGSEDADPYRNGAYAVGYLAPHNYHRVHSAWRGRIRSWRYLPGLLYPVNKQGIAKVHGVLARNERVVAHCDTEFGPAALVMVGATCVGHMRVCFTDLCANEGRPGTGLTELAQPVEQGRGDEFGVFEMGSTIVMVLARGDVTPARDVPFPVKVGEPFLRLTTSQPSAVR